MMDIIVRLTPYARFDDIPGIKTTVLDVGKCCNKGIDSPYCPNCGAKVVRPLIEKIEYPIDYHEILEEIDETLCCAVIGPRDSSFFFTYIWSPNRGFNNVVLPAFSGYPNADPVYYAITPDTISKSIAAFQEEFSGELEVLAKAYGKPPIFEFGWLKEWY